MKLTKIYLLITLSLVLGFSSRVSAIGLRCGTRLIALGDTKAKVISHCGVPNYTEEWEEEQIMKDFRHRFYSEDDYEWGREPFLVKVPVKMEKWYYNFGPTQLIYYLRFRNGKLIKISTGERGY